MPTWSRRDPSHRPNLWHYYRHICWASAFLPHPRRATWLECLRDPAPRLPMFLRVGPAAFSQNIWGRIPGYRIVSDPRIINRVPVSTALSAIFSLEVRKQRFAVSKNLWAKTRVDPCPVWIPEAEGFTAEDIPRPYKSLDDPSLLTVYDLLARGRYFFNSKAVHIESEMSCLTLWCPYLAQAMRMCNSIFPPRFLTFVGPFVAEQTTHCYLCELFPIQLLRILSHVVFSRVCKWRAERNRELAQASDILHQGQLFGSQFHPWNQLISSHSVICQAELRQSEGPWGEQMAFSLAWRLHLKHLQDVHNPNAPDNHGKYFCSPSLRYILITLKSRPRTS